MTPEETLKKMEAYLRELEEAQRRGVRVGLPSDKVGSEVYGNVTLMQVGGMHEYGTVDMEQRSFLRMPFELKSADIDAFIQKEYSKVLDGKSTTVAALNRIGLYAANISKEAFRTNGFGQWSALSPITKAIKAKAGKSTPMVWSGLLRGSITWSLD